MRGINGHTQCGIVTKKDMLVLGMGGFRLSHSIAPHGVCLVCLNKSRRIRMN